MFDESVINEQVTQHLKGEAPEKFLARATGKVAQWLRQDPANWMQFGPWWPAIHRAIAEYQPSFAGADWPEETPDYLAHYTYGSLIKDWVAAFLYLERNGEYMLQPDQPHSIQLATGEHALYVPTLGLIDDQRYALP